MHASNSITDIPWSPDRLGWLGLAWFIGFGARTLRKLRARFPDDGERAFYASRDELLALGVAERYTDGFIAWRHGVDLEMFARRLETESIRFILDSDVEFPPLFNNSTDPPGALFIRGAPLRLLRPVAMVGTRAMTPYGARVTEQLCADLVVAGCEIISGLALGIDGKVHEAVLRAGGKTIAVLPGGCNDNMIYPRTHAPLARRILQHSGTLLTEFPPGCESLKHHFPLRNRLIASMTQATIVIEAAESSGSLITAKLALEENREVFAVPGPITSDQSRGTNSLLSQGAIPCLGAQDIFNIFQIETAPIDTHIELLPEQQTILQHLEQHLHIDDIIRFTQLSPAMILSHLAILELKRCVEDQGGGIYRRTTLGKRMVD